MMYTAKDADHLAQERAAVSGRVETLFHGFNGRSYRTDRAWEFAMHGVCRRFATMSEAIDIVFEALPLDLDGQPTDEDRARALVGLQAFIINTFGCADNLATVWVEHRDVRKANAKSLPPMLIGFNAKCEEVRGSFSQNFRNYLETRADWFEVMENFRHGLAHRIPPYIPPYTVSEANHAREASIDAEIMEAARAHDFERVATLDAEQDQLRVFAPVVTHSWWANAPVLGLHAQMLSDFATVAELADKVLAELAAHDPPP
jgi:hypothetical protein